MTDAALVERVVEEVIRRLRESETSRNDPNNRTAKTLAIEHRVVTLATLEGRLEGVDQVVVHPDAVVTPSVRDALNERNIKLTRK